MISAEILRIVFSFIAVLGLIGVCALAARKFGLASAVGNASGKKRLALVETLAIDARRRLAIIRCDDTEHLIILSATGETVIANSVGTSPDHESTPLQANPFNSFRDAMSSKLNNPKTSREVEAA